VCQNIAAILSAYLPEARLYHYRSHSGLEVDFIIECGERVIAVEAKSSSRVDARDLKALSEFVGREKRCVAGFVVHTGRETVRIGERMWSLPLGILLG
jgi:predicted AAA+ superfamily ATPase